MNIEPRIVTFSWTESDWLQAQRQIFFWGRGTHFFLKSVVYWVVAILLCQYSWYGTARTLPTAQSILEAQIVGLIFYVPLIGCSMLRRRAKRLNTCKRLYRLTPEFFVDQSFEIDNNGLTYRQKHHSYDVPWKIVRTVFLTRDFLVIVNVDSGPNILPRQIFADGGKAWYDVISEHIKENKGDVKSP